MTSALGLSKSIRNQACQLFWTAQNDDLLRGRSIEAVASACIYDICRLNEQPRTFGEIARVSKVADGRIRHCYRILNRELGLPVPPADPKQYLPQIVSVVDAHHETEQQTRVLLEEANDRRVANGQNSMGVAAGALYLASHQTGEHLIQKTVSDAVNISAMTVQKRYQDLQEELAS